MHDPTKKFFNHLFRTLIFAVLLSTSALAQTSSTYEGDPVTSIVVKKSDRKMFLLHHNKILRQYSIGLGFSPEGHKKIEGDGKTPEGKYFIDRKNPNSKFHLSLGISYPNAHDKAHAAKLGKSPGGDIFIHGHQDLSARLKRSWKYLFNRDWTAGCIAVTDSEMTEIYTMIDVGTPIFIQP